VSLIVAESAGGMEVEGEDDVVDDAIDNSVETSDIDDGDKAENSEIAYILTATENGYGKRTALSEYPRKGRGTQGVIGIQTTERNGKLVAAVMLGGNDEVLLISDGGTLVRTPGLQISRVGRNTQGVTLIRLSKGEKLQAVERLDGSLDDDADDDGAAAVARDVLQDTPTAP
jgi:DNA gyrase subunit A